MTTQDERTTAQTWEMWFTPFPKTVYIARRQVGRTLTGWGVPEDAVDTAVLITSELVTNAIRHCDIGHLVHVHLTDDGTVLLLEVSDPSRQHPRAGGRAERRRERARPDARAGSRRRLRGA
jgi:anti-sigma regulatory factor (Ser/Thr protein kinase)